MRAKQIVADYFPSKLNKRDREKAIMDVMNVFLQEISHLIHKHNAKDVEQVARIIKDLDKKWMAVCYTDKLNNLKLDAFKSLIANGMKGSLVKELGWEEYKIVPKVDLNKL